MEDLPLTQKKIEELKKALLPALTFADLSDVDGFEYLNGLDMPKITPNKILKTIKRLLNRKVPRPDQIPNEVLKLIGKEICCYLEQIFDDSLKHSHYPSHFKESTTVILQK